MASDHDRGLGVLGVESLDVSYEVFLDRLEIFEEAIYGGLYSPCNGGNRGDRVDFELAAI